MIKVNEFNFTKKIFGDGTMQIVINESSMTEEITDINIIWHYENEAELIELIYLVNTIRQIISTDISLTMPYIPNSRMDRIHSQYESFTLKYFADIINSLNFFTIHVLDVHSDVSSALINNITYPCVGISVSALEYIFDKHHDLDTFTIMFPDSGAEKRYRDIFSKSILDLNFHFIVGNKVRDWTSGKILDYNLICHNIEEARKHPVIIVDDICSYGGTFVNAAKKLIENGFNNKRYLFVTHCENNIFKGDLLKDGLIDSVITTNSIIHDKELMAKFNNFIEMPIECKY